MASRIAPQDHEPVELSERRYMSTGEKQARWHAVHGICRWCAKVVAPFSDVIWDHRIALALGGTNDLANMEPLHVECSKQKTALDLKAIAKAKRLSKPKTPAKRTIPTSPFQTTLSRGLDGRVRKRK